jgi:hypothetical protein
MNTETLINIVTLVISLMYGAFLHQLWIDREIWYVKKDKKQAGVVSPNNGKVA